jgi:hypothetical protein
MVDSQTSVHNASPVRSTGKLASLWAGIEVRVPFGFQDETGFHFGMDSLASLLELLSENQADFDRA